MDKGLLEEAAKRAGVELTAAMLEQTICYVDLLREANRKMNPSRDSILKTAGGPRPISLKEFI